MNDSRSDDQLRALLRNADPADDDREPTEEEHAALRRLVLNRIPDRNPSWKWLPIATATAAMLVAAALLIGPYRTRPATDLGAPDRPDVATQVSPEAAPNARRQQIQFATEKGTRIIWVLDPDLTL